MIGAGLTTLAVATRLATATVKPAEEIGVDFGGEDWSLEYTVRNEGDVYFIEGFRFSSINRYGEVIVPAAFGLDGRWISIGGFKK